ncbi:MAG: RluA family pseudouridine synthase [Bradyrhizobiaceae bacterium]|nr:RluA family pseudouridine synthase [Bradyrhizobiaceae bacterium]
MRKRRVEEAENVVRATAGKDDAGARLDRFLAAHAGEFSRSRLKQLLLDGEVRIGGRTIKDPAYRVKSGDRIELIVPPAKPARPQAQSIPLNVVYEDGQIIVIDKPAGLVVHPAAGNEDGTLVNALIAHCGASLSGIGGEKRPGIVHRLDKDTSGLLVVAKTDKAHRGLAQQFADHGRHGPLVRAYLAVVWGVPEPRRGTIDLPIARDPRAREKMAVLPGGRRAVTHYEVLDRFAGADRLAVASLVECRLATGRTHQIRVHMTRAGHPLLGDEVYGAGFRSKASQLGPDARRVLSRFHRQALHAYQLGFAHPTTGKTLRFESPLPADMAKLVEALKTP